MLRKLLKRGICTPSCLAVCLAQNSYALLPTLKHCRD